jgi:hypothetical protein
MTPHYWHAPGIVVLVCGTLACTKPNPEYCDAEERLCEEGFVCDLSVNRCVSQPDAMAPDAGPTARLTVEVTGMGVGSVFISSANGDSSCAEPRCEIDLPLGSDVTMSAIPDMGATFGQWSGECGGFDSCSLTLDASRSVIAEFKEGGVPAFARQVGDPGSGERVSINAATFDGDGNIFVAGEVEGNVTVAGSFIMTQARDLFVAKYSAAGSPLWATHANGAFNDDDRADGLAVDANGNVYVVGQVDNSQTVPGPMGDITVPQRQVYVAKLHASSGSTLWSQELGGVGFTAVHRAAIDRAGNLVVSGSFFSTLSFSGEDYVPVGEADGFVAWYGPDGSELHFVALATAGADFASDVAIASDGDVIVTGVTDSPGNPFLARYTPAGAERWALREFIGGAEWTSLVVDSNDAIYIVGTHSGSLDFGGKPSVQIAGPAGSADAFLAAFDSAGSPSFVASVRSTQAVHVQQAALNQRGDLVLVGRFEGDVVFGDSVSEAAGTDAFIAALAMTDGAFRWRRVFSSPSFEVANSIVNEANGNLLVGGNFVGSVDFGETLTCEAAGCAWFGRYGP